MILINYTKYWKEKCFHCIMIITIPWRQIAKNGQRDVRLRFESGRMAAEYYDKLYK